MAGPADRFFLYTYCNELEAMRAFYTELVGLDEIFYAPGDDGGLGYHHGDVQFTVLAAAEPLPVATAWARQPGWSGGEGLAPSWSFQLASLDAFRAAVTRLAAADVPRLDDRPQWRGYWSYVVRDPMGHTVEVTHAPAEAPDDPVWTG